MRSTALALFVALTAMVYVLFSIAPSTGAKDSTHLDSQAHVLEFLKSVPNKLNYQGFLVDAADSSAVTATLEMTFRLFDSETKGAELWSETHSAVDVSNGLFQVLLGSITSFPTNLFDAPSLWLQTEAGSEILVPRKPLVSVAYSQRAEQADQTTNANWATEAQHAIYADTADYTPSAGAWTVDGDNVYRETGKVGIGTTSPLTELDVNGSVNATTYYGDGSNLTGISGTTDNDWVISGDNMYSNVSGYVGIGTVSPDEMLHVANSGDGQRAFLEIETSHATNWGEAGLRITTPENTWHLRMDDDSHNNLPNPGALSLRSQNKGFELMTWQQDGHIGMGTTYPETRLHVMMENVAVPAGALNEDVLIVESQDAILGLYSNQAGSVGSVIAMGEVNGGVLVDKWSILRETPTGGSGLRFTYGTSHNPWLNDGIMYLDDSGDVGIGTTSPAAKLEVQNTAITGNAGYFQIDNATNDSSALYATTNGSGQCVHGDHHSGNYGYLGSDEYGAYGEHSNGNRGYLGSEYQGVYGYSAGGTGMYGQSSSGKGVQGYSATSYGVYGENFGGNSGYLGGTDYAAAGISNTETGVYGYSNYADGVSGEHGSGNYGRLGGNDYGVRGYSSSGQGAWGSSTSGTGVLGSCGSGIGVYGNSSSGYGVRGHSTSNYAGYFDGDVHITGTLTGGKRVIDHPLNPENKLLRHNFVESPENLLIYRGKTRLNASGEAVVDMPDYFPALTKEDEASIHLTPAGRPFLTGADWNLGFHSFTVYGEAHREVFWEVLASRDDPVIHQLARPVEEAKGPDNKLCDRGELLYPTAYGYPESMGRDYKEREDMEVLKPKVADDVKGTD